MSVALADVDPTNFVYYGHYLRYNERAANACIGEAAGPHCCASLKGVELSKYVCGVRWNDSVDIRTTCVPMADEPTLMHEVLCRGSNSGPSHIPATALAIAAAKRPRDRSLVHTGRPQRRWPWHVDLGRLLSHPGEDDQGAAWGCRVRPLPPFCGGCEEDGGDGGQLVPLQHQLVSDPSQRARERRRE